MWRYIDPDGNMQGPFPAQNMVDWYMAEYLNSELPVCGTERKVSPPNLPTPEYFVPLGRLVAYVRQGHKFEPVRVEDVREGAIPEFLRRLKEPPPAAPGRKKEGARAQAGHKSAAQLAAEVAAAAVRAVLVACGELPPEPSPAVATAGAGRGDGALAARLAADAVHAVLVACGERPAVPEAAPGAAPEDPALGSAVAAAAIAAVVAAHDAPAGSARGELPQQEESAAQASGDGLAAEGEGVGGGGDERVELVPGTHATSPGVREGGGQESELEPSAAAREVGEGVGRAAAGQDVPEATEDVPSGGSKVGQDGGGGGCATEEEEFQDAVEGGEGGEPPAKGC